MGQDVTCNLNSMSSGCSFGFFHRFAHHEHSEQLLSEEEITGKFYHVNIYLIAQNISSSHTTRCLELLFIYSLLLLGCTWLRNLPKIKVQKFNGFCSHASAFSCSLLLWQVVLYACFASRLHFNAVLLKTQDVFHSSHVTVGFRSLSRLSVWSLTLYLELLLEWWSYSCSLKQSGSLWIVIPISRFEAYSAVQNGFEVCGETFLLMRKPADLTKCFLCA